MAWVASRRGPDMEPMELIPGTSLAFLTMEPLELTVNCRCDTAMEPRELTTGVTTCQPRNRWNSEKAAGMAQHARNRWNSLPAYGHSPPNPGNSQQNLMPLSARTPDGMPPGYIKEAKWPQGPRSLPRLQVTQITTLRSDVANPTDRDDR